jgi:hypothetical protein
MRVEKDGAATIFIFSRRNLLTLLAKLDGHPPNSACKIGAPPMYGHYWARVEEDDVHYAHSDRDEPGVGLMPAGRMHPETEHGIRDLALTHGYAAVAPMQSDGQALLAFQREQATIMDRPGFPADTVLDPRD